MHSGGDSSMRVQRSLLACVQWGDSRQARTPTRRAPVPARASECAASTFDHCEGTRRGATFGPPPWLDPNGGRMARLAPLAPVALLTAFLVTACSAASSTAVTPTGVDRPSPTTAPTTAPTAAPSVAPTDAPTPAPTPSRTPRPSVALVPAAP